MLRKAKGRAHVASADEIEEMKYATVPAYPGVVHRKVGPNDR